VCRIIYTTKAIAGFNRSLQMSAENVLYGYTEIERMKRPAARFEYYLYPTISGSFPQGDIPNIFAQIKWVILSFYSHSSTYVRALPYIVVQQLFIAWY
jgi:hypothetical protein